MNIGAWVPLEQEVVTGMVDAAGNAPGVNQYHDIGCGDGRMLDAADVVGIRNIYGVEIDPTLAQGCIDRGLDVTMGDVENYTLSELCGNKACSAVTVWCTDPAVSVTLMEKCWNELPNNGRLIWLYDSRRMQRDGVPVDVATCGIPPYPLPAPNGWTPIFEQTILGNRFFLFVR